MSDKPEIQGRPSDLFEFIPTKDITAYELALILQRVSITVQYSTLLKFPESMRRHFVGRPRQDDGLGMRRRR